MSTAASEALPEQSATAAHVYLTLDEDNEDLVLELVKSDETGMYIRDNGTWWAIDPDADNPRVWDRVIIDVREDAAELFDKLEAEGTILAARFADYEINDEESL